MHLLQAKLFFQNSILCCWAPYQRPSSTWRMKFRQSTRFYPQCQIATSEQMLQWMFLSLMMQELIEDIFLSCTKALFFKAFSFLIYFISFLWNPPHKLNAPPLPHPCFFQGGLVLLLESNVLFLFPLTLIFDWGICVCLFICFLIYNSEFGCLVSHYERRKIW